MCVKVLHDNVHSVYLRNEGNHVTRAIHCGLRSSDSLIGSLSIAAEVSPDEASATSLASNHPLNGGKLNSKYHRLKIHC